MTRSSEARTFRATVDRIEGDLAVLELPEGNAVEFPLRLLPRGVGDGAVLSFRVSRDRRTEAARREEIARLQEELLGGGLGAGR